MFLASRGVNGKGRARGFEFEGSVAVPKFIRLPSNHASVASVTLRYADPDALTERVHEGTLVTDYPSVNPIACLGMASASAKSLR